MYTVQYENVITCPEEEGEKDLWWELGGQDKGEGEHGQGQRHGYGQCQKPTSVYTDALLYIPCTESWQWCGPGQIRTL